MTSLIGRSGAIVVHDAVSKSSDGTAAVGVKGQRQKRWHGPVVAGATRRSSRRLHSSRGRTRRRLLGRDERRTTTARGPPTAWHSRAAAALHCRGRPCGQDLAGPGVDGDDASSLPPLAVVRPPTAQQRPNHPARRPRRRPGGPLDGRITAGGARRTASAPACAKANHRTQPLYHSANTHKYNRRLHPMAACARTCAGSRRRDPDALSLLNPCVPPPA